MFIHLLWSVVVDGLFFCDLSRRGAERVEYRIPMFLTKVIDKVIHKLRS